MHAHDGSTAKMMMIEELAREFPGARRICPFDGERIRRGGRDEKRRRGRGGTNATEPAAGIAAQVQHAQVQAGGRLDEDRLVTPSGHPAYRVPPGEDDVNSFRMTFPPFITNFTR